MYKYTISTTAPTKEELWEMIQDCVDTFFGDGHKIKTPEEFFQWLLTYTVVPLFGYVDGKLATCTYLVDPIPGHKAAVHCFVHPTYRSPQHTVALGKKCFGEYFTRFGFIKLEGFVADYNKSARLMCLRLGMQDTGKLLDEVLYQGQWRDKIIYTLKRSDFYE